MRLLVTNTRYAQAYYILRALRPHAEHVVATLSGRRRGSWLSCHAAWSRLVDRRYRVPSPEADWIAGRVQAENTEREEAFLARIFEICERERIDTIFPSTDPWVYVFSKNRERFAERGIVIPVPDFATLITPLDKWRTARVAEETGFPCPRTFLAESDADAERVASELEPPWVIKPRFTAGSQGLAIVRTLDELREGTRRVREERGAPTVQEFIPGRRKQNFYVVVDRGGEVRSLVAPKILRYTRRIFRSATASAESVPPPPFAERVVDFVRQLGWWGGLTVQTKIDARDDTPKLMEANPRLGARLWYRTELGINEPLMCLALARGEEIESVTDYPLGCLLLEPAEDVIRLGFDSLDLLLYRIRTGLLGKAPTDPSSPPMTLRELLGELRAEYFSGAEKRFNPQFRYAASDPLPFLLWSYFALSSHVRGARRGEFGR